MNSANVKIPIGREELILETGSLARQADGAVLATYGGTVVLATAVISDEPREEGGDFLPLFVDYREKTYAAGKIPGGFFKREGRPSEKEILTARLIDRPLRPLFLKGFHNEIQIMVLVVSSDGKNDPDVVAVNAASAALLLTNLSFNDNHEGSRPFDGPVAAVKVARVDGEFILNPTYEEVEKSTLELIVVGTSEGIIMIESGCNQESEEVVLEAIKYGQSNFEKIFKSQRDLQKQVARDYNRPRKELVLHQLDKGLLDKVREAVIGRLDEIWNLPGKEQRMEKINSITKQLQEAMVSEDSEYTAEDVKAALNEVLSKELRNLILNKKSRVGNRDFDSIRPIECKVTFLPRTHGSGLFVRGETQSLAVTTLGTRSDEQMIEALQGESFKSFMLHYTFPPFSVGEIKPIRGPGRREIGHGALAEKALKVVMPSKDDFPYTIRVVSEILESNGSSSMATVCAAALALMDAGVPIKDAVGGIAMGLIKDGKNTAILTDIQGLEDHFGDMDFKVTGTRKGITAIQMDLKIKGIGPEVLKQSLNKARQARMNVLDKMAQAIAGPRENISVYAPRISVLKVNPTKIGGIIGPGGKTIRKIIDQTGATIDIDDDGRVVVAADTEEALNKAVAQVRGLSEDAEVGKIYNGRVSRLMNFGAFCEILPGKEGLIHISELSDKYVGKVEDVVKIGDEVKVKVIKIDELGRINLSLKQANEGR